MIGLLSVSATILRAGQGPDRYGNRGIDWANPTSTAVMAHISYAVTKATEKDKGGTEATADATLFLPPVTDIKATDRVVIDGKRYEVKGIPAPIVRPGFGVHHIEAQVTEAEG